MKLSFGTRINKLDAINDFNGYGTATIGMLNSLRNLGYHIEANDSSADAEIWFDQPHEWKFSKGPVKIGYHPWESTLLRDDWADIMNQCDEIWTPSPLIADWYTRYAGIRVPVHVYEHGIEHVWAPKERTVNGPLNFLHVGAEGSRKGGWDVVRLFRQAFPRNPDVRLTIKMINSSWNNMKELGKVRYINEQYDRKQLLNLFYDHHVYVYPSAGEGFGLTPFQAIATGMPTATVHEWAPYRRFLDDDLRIGAKLTKTKWPKIHPGQVFRPSFDDVIDRMRYAFDNYEDLHRKALLTADAVHTEYDWDTITDKVFKDLEKRLNN